MMEKGLYLVDWMADDRGLYRVPMEIHAQEGAFLVMAWPEDRTLEGCTAGVVRSLRRCSAPVR